MRFLLSALCAVLFSSAVVAQTQTLRVDYVFSGTDKSQEISLDQMSCFDGWAGRCVNLCDVPVKGNGQIVMTDAAVEIADRLENKRRNLEELLTKDFSDEESLLVKIKTAAAPSKVPKKGSKIPIKV